MSPVHPADRPSWQPKPPRLPAWFTRRFPTTPGRPPKIRTPHKLLDFVFAGVGGVLIGLGWQWAQPLVWVPGIAAAGYGLWLGLMHILSEQQVTDWVNGQPDARDVPEVERPNG